MVPFVNHRNDIKPCCENLLSQDYPNIEIILVNNGSTDGSVILAEECTASNPKRIRLVTEPKAGIPFARNAGLAKATGKFVSFLDVDDRFTPNKLQVLYQQLLHFPNAAMAFGQTLRIYKESNRKVVQDTGIAVAGINIPPVLAIDRTESFYWLPQTGATLIHTSQAREVGGFPENMLMGNDDAGFHLEIASRFPVVYYPGVVVEYFRHEQSEGARLNRKEPVQKRYLDAHLKSTIPVGKKYFHETGDIRMLGLAQRGLFLNYVTCFFKEKSQNRIVLEPGVCFTFYRNMLRLYPIFPYSLAHSCYKIIRRIAHLFNPDKYPL